tara:strand:+ start:1527 stop:2327 length:801 start_codon:yes stop_codon:yes gene_type:complete
METVYCNNCGKIGHQYHQCKLPITSYGIIAFKIMPNKKIQYLMIRRKDTLGYVDFIRGKYSLHNINFIMNMLNEMTINEKYNISNSNFNDLWIKLWGLKDKKSSGQKIEERLSEDKLNQLKDGYIINNVKITLKKLIESSNSNWIEPEWGFPKGRRNHLETDLECALREWEEETGYSKKNIRIIQNIIPYDEIFTGSNYKSYKHRYYIALFNSKKHNESCDCFEKTEVGKMEWKDINDAIESIRPYNIEKIEIVKKIQYILSEYII